MNNATYSIQENIMLTKTQGRHKRLKGYHEDSSHMQNI